MMISKKHVRYQIVRRKKHETIQTSTRSPPRIYRRRKENPVPNLPGQRLRELQAYPARRKIPR